MLFFSITINIKIEEQIDRGEEMSISKIMAFVFGIAFIVFLYGIIYYSLKIMYKDVKTGGKKKSNPAARKYAVEVINPGASEDLEEGSVILVRTELTIGRREE